MLTLRLRKIFLISSSAFALSLATTAVSAVAILGADIAASSPASADDTTTVASSEDTHAWGGSGLETVVVTGVQFNPNNAPAKASLDTMQPQTIINKSYIEDSVAPTADYVTILAIVPSLTGTDINGPGLSDGNVKNTLRGLPDGDFVMSYDGIPFGDTNGPTHHSESYFPGSTIGGIDVNRGPGNAGNLGAATFGGSINMYSEPLTDDMHAREAISYGSWGTWDENLNVQSGEIEDLGNTRVLANFQDIGSDGYLTFQNTKHDNELLKIQTELVPGWTLTLFGNRNGLNQHVSDNNGATPAQILTYGKNFALQDTDPNLPTYLGYNYQNKTTDMDYVRLTGDVTPDIHLDDQSYTYAYVNKTVTVTNLTQTASNIANGTAQGFGTIVDGVLRPNDIPGYTKLNAYRVWGNIFRAAWDYQIGTVTGELRAGIWWEGSATERQRYYFDVTLCNDPANAPCDPFAQPGLFADTKPKKSLTPEGIGYDEHTGWNQYQPFVELEVHPIEDLTITPGFKYVNWEHSVDAPVIADGTRANPAYTGPASFTTTRALPFAEVNYKIEPTWSAYFQYANGIYVPDITAFENGTPATFPKPQTTTNYQFGSVYYADNLTADGDIYYVASNNTLQYVNCGTLNPPGPPNDTCATNIGSATYKGVEGEMTYTFDDEQFDGMLGGLAIFVNGSVNSAKSSGHQLLQAPFWTAASGLIYKHHNFKLSLIDKATGQQYENSNYSFYKLGAYNNMDFTGSYDLGELFGVADFEFGGGIYNVLSSRKIVSITVNDSTPVGSSAQDLSGRLSSLDQYYFQAERSIQITLKARL